MCLLFTVVCGRVLYVAHSGNFAVGQSYNSYTLLFEQNYTEITDRLGRSMGGTRKEYSNFRLSSFLIHLSDLE